MFRIIIISISVCLLSACGGPIVVPQYSFTPSDKVAVLVASKNTSPTHKHIGTTSAYNYTEPYDVDWGIETAITQEFTRGLQKVTPFEVVPLTTARFDPAVYLNLLTAQSGAWQVNEDYQDVVQRHVDDGIKAVVVIFEEDEVLVESICGTSGCADRNAESYGLYSKRINGDVDQFYKINTFSINIVLLDPPADLTSNNQFQAYYDSRVSLLEAGYVPEKTNDIQAAEWLAIKELILEDFSALGETIGQQLLNN